MDSKEQKADFLELIDGFRVGKYSIEGSDKDLVELYSYIEKSLKRDELLIEEIKNKIKNAYFDRKDYPPYAIMSWDDRVRYHAFILKIIDEVALKEVRE